MDFWKLSFGLFIEKISQTFSQLNNTPVTLIDNMPIPIRITEEKAFFSITIAQCLPFSRSPVSQYVPSLLETELCSSIWNVSGMIDPTSLKVSVAFCKIWLSDDTKRATPIGVFFFCSCQNGLPLRVAVCFHNGQDDGQLLANPAVDNRFDVSDLLTSPRV